MEDGSIYASTNFIIKTTPVQFGEMYVNIYVYVCVCVCAPVLFGEQVILSIRNDPLVSFIFNLRLLRLIGHFILDSIAEFAISIKKKKNSFFSPHEHVEN